MTTKQPAHRKHLNDQQMEVLLVLFKFRFGTAELISQYMEQSVRYTNIRLKILMEQEYVGRNYDASYRLSHRPATYFLLPRAIKLLKANSELDPKGLHLHYYNRRASDPFIRHCIRLFRIYLNFISLYGDGIDFYTSIEIAEQTQFPRPLPDAYITFSSRYSHIPDCMLELCESTTPLDRLRQRVNRYFAHNETSDWGSGYPKVLMVCDNGGLGRVLERYTRRAIDYRGKGPAFFISSLRSLYYQGKPSDGIWVDCTQQETTDRLTSLS